MKQQFFDLEGVTAPTEFKYTGPAYRRCVLLVDTEEQVPAEDDNYHFCQFGNFETKRCTERMCLGLIRCGMAQTYQDELTRQLNAEWYNDHDRLRDLFNINPDAKITNVRVIILFDSAPRAIEPVL